MHGLFVIERYFYPSLSDGSEVSPERYCRRRSQADAADGFLLDECLCKKNFESILDDCPLLSIPSKRLLWRYCCEYESLIVFSSVFRPADGRGGPENIAAG